MPHALAEQVNMIKKQTAKYRKKYLSPLKKIVFCKNNDNQQHEKIAPIFNKGWDQFVLKISSEGMHNCPHQQRSYHSQEYG